MKFDWENKDDQLKRYIKISPKAKMEWLAEMHETILKASSSKDIQLRWKLRGIY